jgi:CRP-like cAMP-binding protein
MNIYIPELLKNLLPSGLMTQCQALAFKKGDYLFRQGERPIHMFYIVSGEATLTRTGSHGEVTLLQRTTGGFLSEASLFTDLYHCDALVAQTGQAIKLPMIEFKKSLSDQEFALKWIQLLSKEIMRLRTQAERLGLKSIKDKLIHLIQTDGKQGVLNLQSDLKSIASEIGVTHEALYRAIANMEREGLIIKKTNSIEWIK